MRTITSKKNFTRAERVFARVLNELRIPFEAKVKIGKYEVDFLIGDYAIELDGHQQNKRRNSFLLEAGYNVIHFENRKIYNRAELVKWLLTKQI